MQIGERIRLYELVKIDRMGYGAAAIGRLDSGKTVFVEGAAPGDVCKVEIVEDKKRFATAKLMEVVQPSDVRVPLDSAACSGTGDARYIPGAPWAHISYDAQLQAKKQNLVEALVRVGKFEREHVQDIVQDCVACKREWGYRNKIELAGFYENGRFKLGMHKPGSRNAVAVESVSLANRFLENAPRALTGALRFLQGSGDLGIFRVGMRASLRTKSTEVALWTEPSPFPREAVAKTLRDAVRATSVVRVIADSGSARRVKKVEVLEGAGFWNESLCDIDFSVSAPSFFQVNTAQAEKLVELALDGLHLEEGELAADLYCGVGTFSLSLYEAGADVISIELEGSSVRDLRRNAEHNGCDIDIIGDDVARALPQLGELDAIVVDPPRCGLEESVIESIADAQPSRIAYISCDPQTFARDAARLAGHGYKLVKATPVDMFPQTYHQETVGIFRHKK